MTELSVITDPNLPEPKGITNASDQQAYIANGLSGGAWEYGYSTWWQNWSDTGTAQNLTSATWVKITNDGAGTDNSIVYTFPGTGNFWDSSNDQFNWDQMGLALGDLVNVKVDFDVTVTAANDAIAARINFAVGGSSPYNTEILRQEFNASGTYQMVRDFQFYLGSSDVMDNPAELMVWTNTASNTLSMNSILITAQPRKLKWSDM